MKITKKDCNNNFRIYGLNFYGKRFSFHFELVSTGKLEGFFSSLKYLVLRWSAAKREYDDGKFFYTEKLFGRIPLSPYAFYIQFIYPHLGICHPDLRSKYFIGKPVEAKWSISTHIANGNKYL